MQPESYQPNPMTTVQCPRCGIPLDLEIVVHERRHIEYGGACTTPLEGGGRCSTGLRLLVTAHVFSLQSAAG